MLIIFKLGSIIRPKADPIDLFTLEDSMEENEITQSNESIKVEKIRNEIALPDLAEEPEKKLGRLRFKLDYDYPKSEVRTI